MDLSGVGGVLGALVRWIVSSFRVSRLGVRRVMAETLTIGMNSEFYSY